MNAEIKNKMINEIKLHQKNIARWKQAISESERVAAGLSRETYEWAVKNDPEALSELIPQEIKNVSSSYRRRISESRETVARLKRELPDSCQLQRSKQA